MRIYRSENPDALGRAAARETARRLTAAIEEYGGARLVVSTGSSQFETLAALVQEPVDWARVTMFHLDEYLGMDDRHPASFRRYLHERLLDLVPVGRAVLVEGDAANVEQMLADLTRAIQERPVDVGLIGIGQNAHVAFNDPPADFDTRDAYRVVTLNDECKRQQVGEGWFTDVSKVPPLAVSMTVHQILQCRTIISAVPHAVKADAIFRTLTADESPWVPATILRRHSDWALYLDTQSAAKLDAVLSTQLSIHEV